MLLNFCQKHKLQITISLKKYLSFQLNICSRGERICRKCCWTCRMVNIYRVIPVSRLKNNGGKFQNVNIKKTFDSEKDKADHSISETRYVYFLIMTTFLNALTNCVCRPLKHFPVCRMEYRYII